MGRIFKCAPLPFTGQKRFFVRDFAEVLGRLGDDIDTVVDLFGGSGLLSHTAKAAATYERESHVSHVPYPS